MGHSCWSAVAIALLSASTAAAQASSGARQPQAAAGQSSELYHVHVVQAAPGKVTDLEKSLLTPAPNAPNPGHVLLLRHAEGDAWDYLAVEHVGPRATVEAGPIGAARELRAWHEDTFAAGPSWDAFSKAMGLDAQGAAAANAVYVVTTYRGLPGHRAQLDETLQKVDAAAAKPGMSVVMRHVEGAAWDYLRIDRYESWQAFAADQTDAAGEQRQKRAGLSPSARLELREHMATHDDTIATRVVTPQR